MNGTLIVIDGLDGSGKQTQARLLRERLERERVPVRAISFPDYGQPSSALVRLYLDGRFGQADEVSAYAASSFYAVDRFASYMQFWKDDYLSGHTILADRYTTSNLIHQMSKLPREEGGRFIAWLEAYEYDEMKLPRPDLVIYLDMYPDVSRELLSVRYRRDERKKDIHEANFAYLQRCRGCALYAAERFGWRVIPCSDERRPFGIEEIAERVYEAAAACIRRP